MTRERQFQRYKNSPQLFIFIKRGYITRCSQRRNSEFDSNVTHTLSTNNDQLPTREMHVKLFARRLPMITVRSHRADSPRYPRAPSFHSTKRFRQVSTGPRGKGITKIKEKRNKIVRVSHAEIPTET